MSTIVVFAHESLKPLVQATRVGTACSLFDSLSELIRSRDSAAPPRIVLFPMPTDMQRVAALVALRALSRRWSRTSFVAVSVGTPRTLLGLRALVDAGATDFALALTREIDACIDRLLSHEHDDVVRLELQQELLSACPARLRYIVQPAMDAFDSGIDVAFWAKVSGLPYRSMHRLITEISGLTPSRLLRWICLLESALRDALGHDLLKAETGLSSPGAVRKFHIAVRSDIESLMSPRERFKALLGQFRVELKSAQRVRKP